MGRGGGVNPLQQLLLLMKILHFFYLHGVSFHMQVYMKTFIKRYQSSNKIRIAIFDSHF